MPKTQADLASRPRSMMVSSVLPGEAQTRGNYFLAASFRDDRFQGLMDPLIMVDHFRMTQPTFGPHRHSGISAVTVIFEDSIGLFNNQDSLGNNIDLAPGDLYWLRAARGAVHDEKPHPGSRIHAVQVFVDLPEFVKNSEPGSLHVKAGDIPVLSGSGYRVRVILGESGAVSAQASPALPMTILDANLTGDGPFMHKAPASQAIWILCLSGSLDVVTEELTIRVPSEHAVSLVMPERESKLAFASAQATHFVLIQGPPVRRNQGHADRLERVGAPTIARSNGKNCQ